MFLSVIKCHQPGTQENLKTISVLRFITYLEKSDMLLQKHPVTLEEPQTCYNYCRLTLVAVPLNALLCVSVEKAPVTRVDCHWVPSTSPVSRLRDGSGLAVPLRKGGLGIRGSGTWGGSASLRLHRSTPRQGAISWAHPSLKAWLGRNELARSPTRLLAGLVPCPMGLSPPGGCLTTLKKHGG